MSEHNLGFQQPRKGLKKDIKDFQSNLEHQINSFKKRIIEPGEMQIIPKAVFRDGDPQTDAVAVSFAKSIRSTTLAGVDDNPSQTHP